MAYPPEPRPADPAGTAPPPLPPELAGTLAGLPGAEPPPRRGRGPGRRVPAIWFGLGVGAALLILLVVFVAQNLRDVEVSFLWVRGRVPLALAMLVAGVFGALLALAARFGRRS